MRNCDWYLWLNGKKVRNIRELRENFDTAVLIGYFLGGSLLKWLSDIGEFSIVERLNKTDRNGDIGSQLKYAFGVNPDENAVYDRTAEYASAEVSVPAETAADAGMSEVGICTGSFYGNIGSFYGDICSFTNTFLFSPSVTGSFGAVSSFYGAVETTGAGVGSGYGSGILASSYAALVSGQALNVSSYGGGSGFYFQVGLAGFGAGAGSFSYYVGSYKISSFNTFFGNLGKYGSYKGFYAGSFGLSMLSGLIPGSGISGSGGSFGHIGGFFGEGSFYRSADGVVITAEEYHRTLINLSSCPLNAYGYGINLI